MKAGQNHFVASVLVADRPGIMRDITSAVANLGGNVDDISQTVVEGYFTVILSATFDEPHTCENVRAALSRSFREGEASVVVRICEHIRTDSTTSGMPYVLAVTGPDRKGILKCATTLLADKGVNIEDWDCHLDDGSVTYVGELTVPAELDIKPLQEELHRQLSELGMQCSILHKNIFLATNDIGPIRSLLSR